MAYKVVQHIDEKCLIHTHTSVTVPAAVGVGESTFVGDGASEVGTLSGLNAPLVGAPGPPISAVGATAIFTRFRENTKIRVHTQGQT